MYTNAEALFALPWEAVGKGRSLAFTRLGLEFGDNGPGKNAFGLHDVSLIWCIAITYIRGLIFLLTTIHEPPSSHYSYPVSNEVASGLGHLAQHWLMVGALGGLHQLFTAAH